MANLVTTYYKLNFFFFTKQRAQHECSISVTAQAIFCLITSKAVKIHTENHVLKVYYLFSTVGPKRDVVTGEWLQLHNKELNNLYSLPNIVRVIKSSTMRWAGHVACKGERRGVYRVLVETPEGNRPLGRPTRRWDDNIKMDLQEVGCEDMEWIDLAQDRTPVNAVMNLRVP
jgi:hypothetical protein